MFFNIGNECILHKTFHSYIVRAKQGGSQSAQDSKSATGHSKSAGASLRRYNEMSFMQVWKAKYHEIAHDHCIFLVSFNGPKIILSAHSRAIDFMEG